MSFVGVRRSTLHGFEHSKALTKCWRETATCWTLSVQERSPETELCHISKDKSYCPFQPTSKAINVSR